MGIKILVLAALAAAVSAQGPTAASARNPGLAFPYASCIRPLSTSHYSASPVVSTTVTPAGERTCWTLRFREEQCTKPDATINGKDAKCCEQAFHKFEMNIKYECIPNNTFGRPFPATATFKGVPTKGVFSRRFQTSTGVTIFVSDLDTMGKAVEGTQFCLTLNKDSPCPTLATLIPEFPKWSVALWDPNHNCCPVSNGTNPSPPPSKPPSPRKAPRNPSPPRKPSPPRSPRNPSPPRKPPSPRKSPPSPRTPANPMMPPPPAPPLSPNMPPPPSGCETCYDFRVLPTGGRPVLNWFDDKAHCDRLNATWYELFVTNPSVAPFINGFTVFESCSGTSARICGSYKTDDAATTIGSDEDLWNGLLIGAFGGIDQCPSELAGYTLVVRGTVDTCGFASSISSCTFPNPPFPNCGPCNNNTLSTPFSLNQIVTTRAASRTSTYYCVKVETQTPVPNKNALYPKYCAKMSELYKVEFWLSWERRWDIKSIAIIDEESATPRQIAATWSPKADNTLRVTPLRWGKAYVQDSAPKICFEVLNSVGTIFDLTPRPEESKLWFSLFDENQRCCPTTTTIPNA